MQLQAINKDAFSSSALLATIDGIRKATGSPSVSCGVLHQGEIFFTHAEGFCNVEQGIVPDKDTVYPVASNTKAFITALCGILVDEGVLAWTDPISKYLPEFDTVEDPEVGHRATIFDFCSHGTGLAPLDCAGTGFFDEFLNDGSDGVQIAANLPSAYDFRSHWLYNNFLLDVVGTVISKVCGKRSGLVMREKIFLPLGMHRSFTRNDEYSDDKNYARGYSVLDSDSLLLLDLPALEDGSLQGASGYVRSSVHDMLLWANAVMEAEKEELAPSKSGNANTPNNPLRHIRLARCAHRPIILGEGGYENSYGLGWFRHMLPSRYLCSIGPNFSLLPDPPLLNGDGPPRMAIAHWGEFGGSLSAFYTFPDTKSAIVVMANCNGARGDPTDLIAQALCQELFGMTPRIDFEAYARQAAHNSSLLWDQLVQEWVKNRTQNTAVPPLHDFTGTYLNKGLKITIRIFKLAEQKVKAEPYPELLSFNVNSLPRQTAKLRHYHYDTWTFLPNSRDDAARKGMTAFLALPRLLMSFIRNESGKVVSLSWDLQGGSCEGPAPGLARRVSPVSFLKVEGNDS